MATDTREIEWKYEAPPNTPLLDLTDLPRVAAQTPVAEESLDAVYYDTPAFDLLRAGVTLRRRKGGSDAGWHLKIPREGPGVRAELRLPDDEQLPEEFADLLTARVRGRELRPAAQIATKRRVSLLKGDDDQALAELALDEVTAQSFGAEATLTRWDELEIELADGVTDGQSLLEAADKRLRREGIQRSSRPTKLHAALARALDALSEQEPDLTEPPDSPAAPVLAYLRDQLEKLTTWDMAVRRDEYDSVHQMRVAGRRMRAALQAFEPLLRGERVQNLISELRWLGQELGGARDAEVLADHLATRANGIPTELLLGPVTARIEGHYAPVQADARREMLEALSSERYIALLRSIEGFLKYPPLTTTRPADDGSDSVPALVYRAHRRVKRRMRRAMKATPGPQRDTALHEVRKAAKRARYAAEVATLAPGKRKKARRSARAYKKLQSLLGDHHDAIISAAAFRDLALHAYSDGENTFTYGLLYQRELDDAARLAGKAPRAWKRASRKKRLAWMKQ